MRLLHGSRQAGFARPTDAVNVEPFTGVRVIVTRAPVFFWLSTMPDIDPELIKSAIQQIAQDGIATVTVDGHTTTVKSIDELIKAHQFLASQNAAAVNSTGITKRQINMRYR